MDAIQASLEEIGEAGDSEGCSMGEYYEEYRELFNELSMGASDLNDALCQIEEYDGEAFVSWDNCTVALPGDARKVLDYDSTEMDYFAMLDPWDENQGVKETEKRLSRLTKAQLIHPFRQVMVTLVVYMDITGSFDTLSAVVNELDNRAAAMQSGGLSQQMWVE